MSKIILSVIAVSLLYHGVVWANDDPFAHPHYLRQGTGNAALRFTMPFGLVRGLLLARPWTLQVSFRCTHLKHLPNMPPNTYMRESISFEVREEGGGWSLGNSDSRGTAVETYRVPDGGTIIMRLQARPTCAWRVSADAR